MEDNQFIYKKHNGLTALSATLTDFSYNKHSHGEYAIGVTTRGIQHYHLDGSLHLSHKNGIMFFNPEQVHDGAAHDTDGLEYLMIYINDDLLLDVMDKRKTVQFTTPIIYNNTIKTHIFHLVESLFNADNETVTDDKLFNLVNSLTPNIHRVQNQDSLILNIKDEIRNYSIPFNVEKMAERFSMSKFQFIRFFKEHTGITPYQFYLNDRLDNVKKLIEKEKDVYAAVSEFDFTDLTHLNKQFKRMYGVTANNYVKQIINQ